MAAVMLAGAPLCNEVFAQTATEVTASDPVYANTTLKNGLKFYLRNSAGYMKATKSADADHVGTISVVTSLSDATVFEIKAYSSKSFQLWTKDGQLKFGGYTTFHASTTVATSGAVTATDKADFKAIYGVNVDAASKYLGALTAVFTEIVYDQANLETYNANSTTFNFGAEAVEGNVFEGVIPVTFTANQLATSSKAGIYFVKGADDDVKALKAAVTQEAREAAMKKLSVVAVLNETYGINTGVDGEGYKLAMISGADFYKDSKPAAFDNSAFESIKEANCLNADGDLVISITPKLGSESKPYSVIIAAVKASASDPKTYVTTVSNTSTSKFAKVTKPMMGDNTYFAAAEFLKAGEVSAYNIYFTSGKQSTDKNVTEYHKYLVRTSDGTKFQNSALAAKGLDLTTPATQWIVINFDGKYTLTLQNRLTTETLTLRLAATNNKGEYKISSVDATSSSVANAIADMTASTTISGTTIKLVPASLTKYDGAMVFSEDQMKEGVTLAFSGKNATVGAQDFFAAVSEATAATVSAPATYELVPTLTESKAATLNVEKVAETNNIVQFAYLNDKGAVATNDVAKADTLVVPAYKFSIKYKGTDYVVEGTGVTSPTTGNPLKLNSTASAASYYHIIKTANGSYTMTFYAPAASTALAYSTMIGAGTDAVGVQANTANAVDGKFYMPVGQYNNPQDANFVKLNVDLNKSYYTSLESASRHATFENALGSVSMQENKKGIIEGILAAEPTTFWLDTADSETNTPSFYISKGIKAAEETKAYNDEVRNFLVYAPDSMTYFDEATATVKKNAAYVLEGTSSLKAFFHPAALIAEDTMTTVVKGKEVTVVTEKADAAKNQINALKNFQFGIRLADEDVADEYVIYSKANPSAYLYSHNGKLGFGSATQALIVKLGEGDATANEAIAAENNVAVIAGEGVVTVKGAAGKQVVVSNILGQEFANKVATSDEETFAAAVGVVVVRVDGEATKVVVK